MTANTDPAMIAMGLSDLERELLTGSAQGWGSWMFMVGSDLVAKGLGRAENGSIYFDTPDALAVRKHLMEQDNGPS